MSVNNQKVATRSDGATAPVATRVGAWLRGVCPALGASRTGTSLGIGVVTVIALLLTQRNIGYSRDEGFYFDAANRYFDWYKLLVDHPKVAMTRGAIDSHFVWNHEHPPLMKTLFGLSHELLHNQYRWFSEPGPAYRLPSMLIAALGVFVLIQWGSRVYSRAAGIVAGLSFLLMPRVFHHAHLACFDVPVACMCLCSAYLWWRAVESGKLRWSLALGLVYGLTLATKHNAWLLPPAFFLHGLCVKSGTFLKSSWLRRVKLLTPALSLLLLGPLVFFALWPWLWFETLERLTYWVNFHLKHEYYNMEFLGVTYWKPPMPRAYAWVMTLATVPSITLVLFLIGFFGGARDTVLAHFTRLRAKASRVNDERPGQKREPTYGAPAIQNENRKHDSPAGTSPASLSSDSSSLLLWSICLFIFYSPWLSTDTPIFGGTKHWFTAYPFACLFVARGFETLRRALPSALGGRLSTPRQLAWATSVCAVLVLSPGFLTVKDMGPWGLSTYMPIVGGASGAATLGLNRTFWGYTTLSLAPELNARAPARVFIHDTTSQAFRMHVQDGTLNNSLFDTLSVTDSDLALYHHEPHMERVEYQIWAAYATATPSAIGTCEGVPVIWMYDRRQR